MAYCLLFVFHFEGYTHSLQSFYFKAAQKPKIELFILPGDVFPVFCVEYCCHVIAFNGVKEKSQAVKPGLMFLC